MRPFRRRSKLGQEDYNRVVAKGLNRVFEAETPEPIKISKLRAVVISDLHRGARDGADDFERGEPNYSAALGSYLERGYALWLLGDVEELWENDIEEVTESYRALLELERDFALGPGLRRFWGNHDLVWKNRQKVQQKLGEYLPDVEIREALRLSVLDGEQPLGELFLAHGHQGTMSSEAFQRVARFALRTVWRSVQKSQGWLSTTPATSYELRHKHDIALEAWARSRVQRRLEAQPVLIAGHTHHPVFPGTPPVVRGSADAAALLRQLEDAREGGAGPSSLADIRADLESSQAFLRRKRYDPPSEIDPPCYFNTGCCCFPDGDITCVELADEQIHLMRWPNDDGEAKPRDPPLASMSLREVFARMSAAAD